jgi:hypothetical protein
MKTEYSPEQRSFIEKCRSNPAIEAWLGNYHPDTVETFLAKYHENRERWLSTGDYWRKQKQEWLTIAMSRAETTLFYIQQKKLWDLQCLWRAESESVPGVQHSGDFVAMEEKIATLDFLPPITQEELELLKDWLMDRKWSRRLYPELGWQDYRFYISRGRESEMGGLPKYYGYVDERMKKVPLWKVLPDKRGPKEDHYIYHGRKAHYEATHKPQAAEPEVEKKIMDMRPRLYEYSEETAQFAKQFDDHHVNECREAYESEGSHNQDHELKFALEELENAGEPVAMEAHPDWREAIKIAAWKFERMRLVAALDVAYENYCFRRQMGIAYAEPEKKRYGGSVTDPEGVGMEILKGREALGEPQDFNF